MKALYACILCDDSSQIRVCLAVVNDQVVRLQWVAIMFGAINDHELGFSLVYHHAGVGAEVLQYFNLFFGGLSCGGENHSVIHEHQAMEPS